MTPDAGGAWDMAPCALMIVRADGLLLEVNRTLSEWVGRPVDDLVSKERLSGLLSVGGRIYWETHLFPLLLVERRLNEVALDLRGVQGRLPVLLTAVMQRPGDGTDLMHVALSSARERFRYERELLASRRAADRSAASVTLLQAVTASLSEALGVQSVADVVLSSAVGPLGAAAATLWLVGADHELVMYGGVGPATATATPPQIGTNEGLAVLGDGRAAVALRGSTELRGVLAVLASDDAGAEPLDLAMLTVVGQQAGVALERAQLYEQSASVAHELQRALLDVEPPPDDRYEVATAYRPGVEMLEVGGDWYDVFLAQDGVLGVCVGDVLGRGLKAATAMGQLRSALRAVAGPDVGPAGLLSRLDRFVTQVPAAQLATVAYAELDLARGMLRYACAGHPPPLLIPASGPPRLLWEGRSTPLGTFGSANERTAASVQLAAGDRVLLYTDGLFERRDRGLDQGLQILLATAADVRSLPLDDAVHTLTRELLRDERTRDDVCVLLVCWSEGASEARW